MSTEAAQDVLAFLGGALIVAMFVVLLLAMRGRGPIGAAEARRRRSSVRSVVDLAVSRGWSVSQGEEPTGRVWDERLTADRATPVACELVLHGGDSDGAEFVAESWTIHLSNTGSLVRLPARQHLLRIPCPGTPWFLVRGMPNKTELRYFPLSFRDHAGFVQFHTSIMVGGDFAAAQDRLAPYVEAIESSRLWVIGLDDEIVLMSHRDPTAAGFERDLALGRALAAALA